MTPFALFLHRKNGETAAPRKKEWQTLPLYFAGGREGAKFAPYKKRKRMPKEKGTGEVVISTGALNSYGSRILTEGLDLAQYRRNPVLLWMHMRMGAMPIGRMENVRVDGDRVIGTPVFDLKDELAKRIADKWEDGFLRMASAGIEIVELSDDPELLVPGQTRMTVTRSRLVEVSIVDIGANDEAIRLYAGDGSMMELAAGGESDALPLLKGDRERKDNTNQKKKSMKELMLKLGLPETATGEEAVRAVEALQKKAGEAEELRLARIGDAVDAAVAAKRVPAEKREFLVELGRKSGLEGLKGALELMRGVAVAAPKPTDVITLARKDAAKGRKYGEMGDAELRALRKDDPEEFARLFEAEFGFKCGMD